MDRNKVLQRFREDLNKKKGKRDQIQTNISSFQEEIDSGKRSLIRHEQALEIVKKVGIATQQQLQFHVNDITSLALDAVFSDPYKLEIDFVERRNESECDIYFVRNDKRIDPLSASGGGAIDIAAFALRIASWAMQTPKSRNTIILDEPMKFLSVEYREQASKMIKEISIKLGIQFIIITHDPILAAHADKQFITTLKNKVTTIK